ncbi:MAG: hypothetical protein IM574_13435 [Cytophagales bacterium]|jgi:hypothetical protein|nr:hypothetical protein [Cytophagales bacterium]MCA6389602.1 hypothetical protein [Cytophagales bacterium]MCA6390616.1 hypothetical protein [Cytophagales bacterium]MCA6393556.1 hypothetical protein [Cytophagales bacterium]MCA6399945.1 hypothetical protein [Cytophagales bacterium]
MNTTDIRQKLHHYIETAKDKKVKAMYTMVEDEIEETYDYWNDDEFVAELKRRQIAHLKGQTKTHTLSDAASEIKQAIKKVNKKR